MGVGSAVAKIPDEGRPDGGLLLSTTTSIVGPTSFIVGGALVAFGAHAAYKSVVMRR